VYGRPGYGWTEVGRFPRTALQEATELHTMLENARVPTPYLFVVHSVGGFIGRMYADQYANTLSGIVMVDVLQEGVHTPRRTRSRLLNLVPPLGWERLKRLYEGTSALPQELKQAPKPDQDRFLFASSLVQLKSERHEFDSLAESDRELARASFLLIFR
jgi:pimeloyl-ACP methyl ester carboxylesterase